MVESENIHMPNSHGRAVVSHVHSKYGHTHFTCEVNLRGVFSIPCIVSRLNRCLHVVSTPLIARRTVMEDVRLK